MKKCGSCHSFAVNVDPKRKLCDVCFYKVPLSNLLAAVHRDGGHYTNEHGIRESTKDAMKIVAERVVT
jgi:hypothetical protein